MLKFLQPFLFLALFTNATWYDSPEYNLDLIFLLDSSASLSDQNSFIITPILKHLIYSNKQININAAVISYASLASIKIPLLPLPIFLNETSILFDYNITTDIPNIVDGIDLSIDEFYSFLSFPNSTQKPYTHRVIISTFVDISNDINTDDSLCSALNELDQFLIYFTSIQIDPFGTWTDCILRQTREENLDEAQYSQVHFKSVDDGVFSIPKLILNRVLSYNGFQTILTNRLISPLGDSVYGQQDTGNSSDIIWLVSGIRSNHKTHAPTTSQPFTTYPSSAPTLEPTLSPTYVTPPSIKPSKKPFNYYGPVYNAKSAPYPEMHMKHTNNYGISYTKSLTSTNHYTKRQFSGGRRRRNLLTSGIPSCNCDTTIHTANSGRTIDAFCTCTGNSVRISSAFEDNTRHTQLSSSIFGVHATSAGSLVQINVFTGERNDYVDSPRGALRGCLVASPNNDLVYYIGGYDRWNGRAVRFVDVFDNVNKVWLEKSKLNFPDMHSRRYFHACIWHNGNIYVFGGIGKKSDYRLKDSYSSSYEFIRMSENGKPMSDWVSRPGSGLSTRIAFKALAVDDDIWLIGGFKGGFGAMRDIQYLDVKKNCILDAIPMRTGRFAMAVGIGSKVLNNTCVEIVGGRVGPCNGCRMDQYYRSSTIEIVCPGKDLSRGHNKHFNVFDRKY